MSENVTKNVIVEVKAKADAGLAKPFKEMEKEAGKAGAAVKDFEKTVTKSSGSVVKDLKTMDKGFSTLGKNMIGLAAIAGGVHTKFSKVFEVLMGFHAVVGVFRGLQMSINSTTKAVQGFHAATVAAAGASALFGHGGVGTNIKTKGGFGQGPGGGIAGDVAGGLTAVGALKGWDAVKAKAGGVWGKAKAGSMAIGGTLAKVGAFALTPTPLTIAGGLFAAGVVANTKAGSDWIGNNLNEWGADWGEKQGWIPRFGADNAGFDRMALQRQKRFQLEQERAEQIAIEQPFRNRERELGAMKRQAEGERDRAAMIRKVDVNNPGLDFLDDIRRARGKLGAKDDEDVRMAGRELLKTGTKSLKEAVVNKQLAEREVNALQAEHAKSKGKLAAWEGQGAAHQAEGNRLRKILAGADQIEAIQLGRLKEASGKPGWQEAENRWVVAKKVADASRKDFNAWARQGGPQPNEAEGAQLRADEAADQQRLLDGRRKLIDAIKEEGRVQKENHNAWKNFADEQIQHFRQIEKEEKKRQDDIKAEWGLMDPAKRAQVQAVAEKLKAGPGKEQGPQWVQVGGKWQVRGGNAGGLTPEDIAVGRQWMPELLGEFGKKNADKDMAGFQRFIRDGGIDDKRQQAQKAREELQNVNINIQNKVDAAINLNEKALGEQLKQLIQPITEAMAKVKNWMDREKGRQDFLKKGAAEAAQK